MDLLLISPPVANPGQAVAALGVLTAFVSAKGWDASSWDLGLDAFHYFHSATYLARCQRIVQDQGADRELLAAAARVVSQIDQAKSALTDSDIGARKERMRWALGVLRDAGVVLTAAAQGHYSLDFRTFEVPDAFRDLESLAIALEKAEKNPFGEYFEAVALPRLLEQAPRAVGLSVTYFSQLLPAFTLARLIRRELPQVPVVLGGSALTAAVDDVVHVPPAIVAADALILYDGEEALVAWLELVLAQRGNPSDIANLFLPASAGYARAGRHPIRHTDLASAPVPLWTARGLELGRYLVPRYAIPLPLTRGCYWGRCVYCNISSQRASPYRRRPAAMAIADLRAAIAETGSNWFDLPVDSYRASDLRQLATAILEAGLVIEWGAEVLLDPGFTEPVLAELARSGCRSLRFGLESACEATLQAMNKPTRAARAAKIFRACKQHGICTGAMLIVGFPTETQAGLTETLDFLVEHREVIDFVALHPYSLVAGSAMARDPGRFGLYLRPTKAIFATSLPFVNTNPIGMQNEDLPRVITVLREQLREHYPDHGELWAAAIGGWMTFPACCASPRA